MTESEWLAAKTVAALDIQHIAEHKFRKWRLFGCACVRPSLPLLSDQRFAQGVETAERFANGESTRTEVKRLRSDILTARLVLRSNTNALRAQHEASQAVFQVLKEKPWDAFNAHEPARYAAASDGKAGQDGIAGLEAWRSGIEAEHRAQLALAYDIFGNPFRPVAFSPDWRTFTAIAIAQGMYESRDFSAMPILADALQDAGCDSDDLLQHCRQPGEHVRGCWVVDMILGKS